MHMNSKNFLDYILPYTVSLHMIVKALHEEALKVSKENEQRYLHASIFFIFMCQNCRESEIFKYMFRNTNVCRQQVARVHTRVICK